MAYDCGHGWLHLHADWLVLEPVTTDYAPVPAGELFDTVLLANLADRAQPLIRYDLGDRVRFSPDPCACGGPLLATRVEGRTNDVVVLQSGPADVLPAGVLAGLLGPERTAEHRADDGDLQVATPLASAWWCEDVGQIPAVLTSTSTPP